MKFLLPLIVTIPVVFAKPLPLDVVRNTAREIDELLHAGQEARSIKANPITDDSTFVRRSYLNIIGRLPTHDEARSFLESSDQEKRTKLIDSLVESSGFNSRLFNFWTDLLRVQTNNEHNGLGWHVWLKDAVENNMPYDKIVTEMLAADGHAAENPAVGYYLRDRGMLLDNVSNTVQVFLGQQIGCAQCHDHPFDDTTQMEYYQLAAFLGGTDYRFEGGREKIKEAIGFDPDKRPKKAFKNMTKEERRRFALQAKKAREKAMSKREEARAIGQVFRYHNRNALADNTSKELKLPADYQYEDGKPGDVVKPGFLFGLDAKDVKPEQRREYFAKWVTSPKNPYFTKVIANRMWEYAFGYGLVANPDDWNNSPQPHYPGLVNYVEKAMLAANYDLRQFLRILYHTNLFQREVSTEEPAQGFSFDFQGPILRRMSAEEIRDSFITLASGNVDSNTNNSFEEAWDDYVKAFDFLMSTNSKQLKEISTVVIEGEKQRRALQKETSILRTKAQKARENGNMAAFRKVSAEIRSVQKKYGKGYSKGRGMNENSVTTKAAPALARRARTGRPDEPEFRMRASELPVPARGGTFLAEFGGSDAESPSSAHTEATVPQTLRLLNGLETSLLTNKKNSFARSLRAIESPSRRLDFLFLSLYSAFPTEDEKEAFLPEMKTPESTETFARAILTSNRFLFVQ
ncbi:DUF1549 and DUF1553 domain-containing protein [Akkermansiaceae bacterium]|nr:DUF1549 and DUF1553 domain-containing protein [Akkermansiaceae bacterium]MDB4509923.1 DUF1549 and DUF1553 domain-containing protein [Akkermansiaceae bacterium]